MNRRMWLQDGRMQKFREVLSRWERSIPTRTVIIFTPTRLVRVDKDRRTQVGRALDRVGVEHTQAYSPEARGRMFGTLQDRLVKELAHWDRRDRSGERVDTRGLLFTCRIQCSCCQTGSGR
jgi:hypothetical protein